MRNPGTFNPGGHNRLIGLSFFRSTKITKNKEKTEKAAAIPSGAATAVKTIEEANKKANDNSVDWTTDQDAQLRKLKVEEGAQWKTIAMTLGKNVGEVKKRWGEIRPKDGTGDKKPGDKAQEVANTKKQRQKINKVFAVLGGRGNALLTKPDDNFTAEEVRINVEY